MMHCDHRAAFAPTHCMHAIFLITVIIVLILPSLSPWLPLSHLVFSGQITLITWT